MTFNSAKASCQDITCESIPGSPPPFLFFVGVSLGTRLLHGHIAIITKLSPRYVNSPHYSQAASAIYVGPTYGHDAT